MSKTFVWNGEFIEEQIKYLEESIELSEYGLKEDKWKLNQLKKELKLYKCWECGGRYYASEMITTDKKNEVGDFCKKCWKDMGKNDE